MGKPTMLLRLIILILLSIPIYGQDDEKITVEELPNLPIAKGQSVSIG